MFFFVNVFTFVFACFLDDIFKGTFKNTITAICSMSGVLMVVSGICSVILLMNAADEDGILKDEED